MGLHKLELKELRLDAGQRCKMPEDWRGRYFQSGIGEMYVRETRITTKGSCIEQRQDYFLFYSR